MDVEYNHDSIFPDNENEITEDLHVVHLLATKVAKFSRSTEEQENISNYNKIY